ncbi:hypothetical protein ACWEP4_42830 [Streptomyces sp. NPDC004227]
MVGIDDDHGHGVAVAGDDPAAAGGVGVAAQEPGHRVLPGGVQLAAHPEVVGEGSQGERHGGGGDDKAARWLP